MCFSMHFNARNAISAAKIERPAKSSEQEKPGFCAKLVEMIDIKENHCLNLSLKGSHKCNLSSICLIYTTNEKKLLLKGFYDSQNMWLL